MKLLDGRTTDGDSDAINFDPGHVAIQVAGTFDSATVQLKLSLDGGTTYSNFSTAISAASVVLHEIMVACKLKLTVASAGASTELDAWVVRSP